MKRGITWLRDGTGKDTFQPVSISNIAIESVGLCSRKTARYLGSRRVGTTRRNGYYSAFKNKNKQIRTHIFNSSLDEGEGTGRKNTAAAGATGPRSDGSRCPARHLSPWSPLLSYVRGSCHLVSSALTTLRY